MTGQEALDDGYTQRGRGGRSNFRFAPSGARWMHDISSKLLSRLRQPQSRQLAHSSYAQLDSAKGMLLRTCVTPLTVDDSKYSEDGQTIPSACVCHAVCPQGRKEKKGRDKSGSA